MPRDGAGIYSAPASTAAISGDPISSNKYNSVVVDLVSDANLVRPVVAGGTGGGSVSAAQAALGIANKAGTETISGAWTYTVGATFNDDVPLMIGTDGGNQLLLSHNQTATAKIEADSTLHINAGDFFQLYSGNAFEIKSDLATIKNKTGTETLASFSANGPARLFYDDSSKLSTKVGGVDINGQITAETFTPPPQPAQATNAGTVVDFGGIPATATTADMMISGVSLDGTSELMVQMGTSSGFETAGYLSSASFGTDSFSITSGFLITRVGSTARAWTGIISFNKIDGDQWVQSANIININSAISTRISAGSVVLPGPLSQLRLTSTGTPDTFTGGIANIRWS